MTGTRGTTAVAVRRARPEDAAVIATLHVASWHETYIGLLPDAMIAALTVEVRQAWWTRLLGKSAGDAGRVGLRGRTRRAAGWVRHL